MNREFGATYYGARVSWIYPGALLHSFFAPPTANLILKLGCSAILASTIALFGWRAAGLWSAAIGVGLAVFSPQIITALHADYTDTPVMVYGLLCVSAILLARDSQHPYRWITGAGIAFSLMALSNLGAIANLGVGIALFHLLWINRGFADQLKFLGIYILTALLVVQCFQMIHQSLGNEWHILAPQWRMVTRLNNMGTDNPWYIGGWAWMGRSTWLIIPFAAFFWGVGRTYFRPSTHPWIQELCRALTVSLAFALLVGFILEIKGTQVIGLFYYASSLLCLAFPLLLLLLTEHLNFLTGRVIAVSLTWIGLAYVALFPLPVIYNTWFGWLRTMAGSSDATIWVGFTLLLAAGLLLGQFRKLHRLFYPIGAILTLVGLMYLSISQSFKNQIFNDRLKQRYTAVHDAFAYLSANFEPDSFRLWIDRDFSDAAALASARLWGYRLWVTDSFPDVLEPASSAPTVIVPNPIGTAAVTKTQIEETLARFHFEPEDFQVVTIPGEDELGFELSMFKIIEEQFDPESPPPEIPRPLMIAGYEYHGVRRYSDYLYFQAVNGESAESRIESTQSAPWLHRVHSDDYAYLDYRILSQSSRHRRLGLVVYLPFPGSVQLVLEDNLGRKFAKYKIDQPGRSFRIVTVPRDAQSFRLLFSSPDLKATVLPTNINIYDIIEE